MNSFDGGLVPFGPPQNNVHSIKLRTSAALVGPPVHRALLLRDYIPEPLWSMRRDATVSGTILQKTRLCRRDLAFPLSQYLGSMRDDTAWFESLFTQLRGRVFAAAHRLLLLSSHSFGATQNGGSSDRQWAFCDCRRPAGSTPDLDPAPAGKIFWSRRMAAVGNRRRPQLLGQLV